MGGAQTRILIAILTGIILVTGAFWYNYTRPEVTLDTALESAGLSDRRHIPVSDSNIDGVPDWQDNLIDTEPIFIDASSTNEYEISDTLTDQFSVRFFEDILTLDANGVLEEATDDLVEAAMKELEEKTKETLYTESDLNIISTTDPKALNVYGNLVAGNIILFQTKDKTEEEVFFQLTKDENPRHLEKLAAIETQYKDTITALLELETPEQYTFEHLAIVNSLSALEANAAGMQQYFDDPLVAAVRYRRLQADALNLRDGIISLYNTLYLDEGIPFQENQSLRVLAEVFQ